MTDAETTPDFDPGFPVIPRAATRKGVCRVCKEILGLTPPGVCADCRADCEAAVIELAIERRRKLRAISKKV